MAANKAANFEFQMLAGQEMKPMKDRYIYLEHKAGKRRVCVAVSSLRGNHLM